jgi:hypothetical protein
MNHPTGQVLALPILVPDESEYDDQSEPNRADEEAGESEPNRADEQAGESEPNQEADKPEQQSRPRRACTLRTAGQKSLEVPASNDDGPDIVPSSQIATKKKKKQTPRLRLARKFRPKSSTKEHDKSSDMEENLEAFASAVEDRKTSSKHNTPVKPMAVEQTESSEANSLNESFLQDLLDAEDVAEPMDEKDKMIKKLEKRISVLEKLQADVSAELLDAFSENKKLVQQLKKCQKREYISQIVHSF